MNSTADEALLTFLKANDYQHLRLLPDGTYAGLVKLMFTTAIVTGMDWSGYAYRFCFKDPDKALSELKKLENMDDEPTGFIARRG